MTYDLAREITVAETIARVAHWGQQIKSTGDAFITHPTAVASRLPATYKPAGWLHDVLEDTPVTAECLLGAGVSIVTVSIVGIVSRLDPMHESYKEFIDRIVASGSVGAILVKLADLDHNCRPGCPPDLLKRYVVAIPILQHALQALQPVTD